jgi:hypothetical protein
MAEDTVDVGVVRLVGIRDLPLSVDEVLAAVAAPLRVARPCSSGPSGPQMAGAL